MAEIRDWRHYRDRWARLLEERTGEGVAEWMRRIERERLPDTRRLRAWLAERGVTGYAQTLLVMERFGYPDFALATAQELIDAQYADRPALRPILDALLDVATRLDGVSVQARKSYVSILTPRRTFARVQATTRTRVDLGLRLEGRTPGGRLVPSKIHETMPLQIGLASPEEVDDEALGWLRRAYDENR